MGLIFLMASCITPQILYLGERYPPYQPRPIDIFYDEGQIEQPYQIIGSLVNAGDGGLFRQDRIQEAMITEAEAVGADAIVFYDIDVELTGEGQSAILKAKAIRY